MDLSELTILPAAALPKDFQGVVFLEYPRPMTGASLDRIRKTIGEFVPGVKLVILDDGLRLAHIVPSQETVTS